MRRVAFIISLSLFSSPSISGDFVARRFLEAGRVLTHDDVASTREGADVRSVIGLVLNVPVAADAPVPLAALSKQKAIVRNQMVELVFRRPGLTIRAQARSLGAASLGETVRVLNLASRQTVSGVAIGSGLVEAGAVAVEMRMNGDER